VLPCPAELLVAVKQNGSPFCTVLSTLHTASGLRFVYSPLNKELPLGTKMVTGMLRKITHACLGH
jgi:hypothetical protein